MPLILIAPLTIFVMLAVGVRGRRATANIALFGPLVALLGVFLAGWALLGKRIPQDVTYTWLDIPLSISGASQFQNFSASVGIRISHASSLLVTAALLVGLFTLVWSRIGARGEPAPARYYGAFALLTFAAVGVLVATDYLELLTFWGIAGVSTYLLMTHYWTDEAATRSGRLGLALPALTDLALLAGVSILYSRYGQTNIDGLIPVLHLTPGAGNRALVVATLLIFSGAAGRAALFPFQGWLTAAADVPPAAYAAIQGLWPLMVTSLLYKSLPIFVSAGPWPLRIVAATAAVSAILVPLSGLAGFDIRRVVTTAGIGLTSLVVLSFARPGIVGLAIVGGAGSGLARAALVLATASLVTGMRSTSLAQMGEGLRRMPRSVLGLLFGGAGLAFVTVEMAAQSLRPDWYLAYAAGIVLSLLLVFRAYFVAAVGALVRRRGFDPNRIRETSHSLTVPSLVLGSLAFGLAVAAFSTRFLTYVDGKAHTHPVAGNSILWVVFPLVGAAAAFVLFHQRRDVGTRLTGLVTDYWARVLTGGLIVGRLIYEPVLRLAGRADDVVENSAEAGIGRALTDVAAVSRRRVPILTLLVGLVMVAVVLAGVFLPGIAR